MPGQHNRRGRSRSLDRTGCNQPADGGKGGLGEVEAWNGRDAKSRRTSEPRKPSV